MKCHVGVDAGGGLVHTVTVTSANKHDITETVNLIREDDEVVYGDSGYLGVQKRSEIQQNEHFSKVDFRINRRPKSLPKVSDHAIDWERYIEHRKSSIRSKVEHVFRIIKCQFGYKKSRLPRIKEKRKSFICPVCLCQFVFAGDCRSKTFHNINQGGKSALLQKRKAANQRKSIFMSKDKPCILKKRLNGVLDQNIGLIIQRFPNNAPVPETNCLCDTLNTTGLRLRNLVLLHS